MKKLYVSYFYWRRCHIFRVCIPHSFVPVVPEIAQRWCRGHCGQHSAAKSAVIHDWKSLHTVLKHGINVMLFQTDTRSNPTSLHHHHHHHHHLSRSCHCWQMASTTHAMHFDFEPPSSIDCYQLPRCCLSISFWVSLLLVFLLWVSSLMLSWPTWCCSF